MLGTGAVNDNVARQIIDHAHRHVWQRVVVAVDADPPGDLAALLETAMVDLDVGRLRTPERYGGTSTAGRPVSPTGRHHLGSAVWNEPVEWTRPQPEVPVPPVP